MRAGARGEGAGTRLLGHALDPEGLVQVTPSLGVLVNVVVWVAVVVMRAVQVGEAAQVWVVVIGIRSAAPRIFIFGSFLARSLSFCPLLFLFSLSFRFPLSDILSVASHLFQNNFRELSRDGSWVPRAVPGTARG